MNEKRDVLARAVLQTRQLAESVTRRPLLELTGERRVLIENYITVADYSLSEVCIKVCYGYIRVQGKYLHLEHMTRDSLLITGQIDNICLCRGCHHQ